MGKSEFAIKRPRNSNGTFVTMYNDEERKVAKQESQNRKTKDQRVAWNNTYYDKNKEIHNSRSRKYYQDNKETIKIRYKNYHKIYKWGLTPEKYQEIWDRQKGRCAVCSKDLTLVARVHVDHDHTCCSGQTSCGKCIRGLLDQTCNNGIGFLKDDSELLRNAAEYLDNFKIGNK